MKARLLSELGFSAVVEQRFSRDFAQLSAEDFVTGILEERLGISHAVTGFDFHFGKNRQGGPAFLMASGEKHGFGVTLVDAFRDEDAEIVSSSRIRELLAEGDVVAGRRPARLPLHGRGRGDRRPEARPHAGLSDSQHEAAGRTPRSGTASMPCGFAAPTARCMTAWRASAAARRSTRTARRCSRRSCSISPAISTARSARCRSSASCAARRNSTGSTRWSRR